MHACIVADRGGSCWIVPPHQRSPRANQRSTKEPRQERQEDDSRAAIESDCGDGKQSRDGEPEETMRQAHAADERVVLLRLALQAQPAWPLQLSRARPLSSHPLAAFAAARLPLGRPLR